MTQAVRLLRPGGELVYSVCTITRAETLGIDEWMERTFPALMARPLPDGPWRTLGRGGLLLPQDADTDGMYVLRLRSPQNEEESDS